MKLATWSTLPEGKPQFARAAGVDLVLVRLGDTAHVLHGRCSHRGALMSGGCLEGRDLVCKAHGWDFRVDTGESAQIEGERLARFDATVDLAADAVIVDEAQIAEWARTHPQAFDDDELPQP
jgi:nitrite reductase/ring-hydroxylating ferredoxin subunit